MVDISNLVSFVIGFALPIAGSVLTNHFGLKQENLTETVQDLCNQIQEQADRASDYWSREFGDPETGGLENKIAGADFYLGAMVTEVFEDFPQFLPFADEDPFFKFSDLTTGGAFQVRGRFADQPRSAEIQREGYRLCVALRRGRRATIFPPKGWLTPHLRQRRVA